MSREDKIERRRREREARSASQSKSMFRKRVTIIGGGAVVVVSLLVAWNVGLFGVSADSHPYGAFAQCLTDNKVTMYGTDWCPNCQNQKKMFESAFKKIDYVNCDFNQQVCNAQGVEGYPTWKIGNTLIGAGVQTFDALAEASGCELPEGL